VKDGRGLKTGFPDIIPLERPDILDDLKQFVDVHRITDFTLHDRVVPTILLKRSEDELIVAFQTTVGALAANFSFVQLWNGTVDKLLRPLAILFSSGIADPIMSFDTVQIAGASQLATPVDRRRVGGPFTINASTIGSFRTNQAVAQVGAGAFWYDVAAAGERVPDDVLRAMALPPGTGLDWNTGAVNGNLTVACAYKVEQINKTRTGGL